MHILGQRGSKASSCLSWVEGPANVPCASLDIICSAGFKERNGYVEHSLVKDHRDSITTVQPNISRRFTEDSANINGRDSTRKAKDRIVEDRQWAARMKAIWHFFEPRLS
jgi:hypothetical protein